MGRVLQFDHHLEAYFNEWSRQALCIGIRDLFYPGPGDTQEPALALCRTCPVRVQCLDYAMTKPEKYGIWGGMNERERGRLKKAS